MKTKRKPNTYYKTPTMRVEGGWVGMQTRSGAARATVRLFLTIVPSRAAHTEHSDGTLGRLQVAEARRARHRAATVDQFFLRRNLPTSRLAASVGFACA